MVMLVIIMPVVFGILVGVIVGDIKVNNKNCSPHTWSRVAMSDKLVCMECSKESHLYPFI